MAFLTERLIPLVIFTGIVLILLSPFPYGTVELWSVSVCEITSIVVFGAWLTGQALNGRVNLKGAMFYLPFGLFFLLILVQIVPLLEALLNVLSPNTAILWKTNQRALEQVFGDGVKVSYTVSLVPYVTKQKLVLYTSYAMFFVVVASYVSSKKQISRLFWVVFSVGIIESLIGLLQFVSGVSDSTFERASGTYVNPNNFAGFLGMVVPFSLGYAFAIDHRGSRFAKRFRNIGEVEIIKTFLLIFAIALMALSLVFSQSRGGILSFAVSLVFFYTLTAWRGVGRARFWSVGLFIIILIAYGLWIGLDPVFMRYSETTEGFSSRIPIWKDTVRLIKDFPALGTGLGTFALSYAMYKAEAAWPLSFSHAHNDYLEIASETGLLGLILVLLGIALIFTRAFRAIKTFTSSGDNFRLFLSIGSMSGISFMLIHALTEFNFQIPSTAYYFVFLLGILTSVVCNEPRTREY